MFIDAGALRERIEILRYEADGQHWRWEHSRKSWAKASIDLKRHNFSVHSVGAAGITFVIRRQDVTPGQMILFEGQHCFVTSVSPRGRQHLEVKTAVVEIAACAYRDGEAELTFQAVVREKYLRHDDPAPMSINTLRYVLVVPKAIRLEPGRLVTMAGEDWEILVAHTLESQTNEYEIGRTVEL